MTTAQDRVPIIEGTPPLHPGMCYLCSSVGGDNRRFMDMGRSMPKYGRIYFCSYCFTELASNLGWVSPSNWEKAELENMTKDEMIRTLKDDNAKLSSLVGSSIPSLMAHLSDVHEVVSKSSSTVKRGPGRPKKPE